MSTNMHPDRSGNPLLSICIASMGRPRELFAQVSRLLNMTNHLPVEIVVVDASKTEDQLRLSDSRLRVLCLEKANGIDADYDLAVEAAVGTYCWLFTDDDLPDADAAERIVAALLEPVSPGLVLIDARVLDPNGNALRDTMLDPFCRLEVPAQGEVTALSGAAGLLTYIGSVVIERAEWLARRSDQHLGSEFQHVGFILSGPFVRPIKVLSPPAISIRYGVAHWESRALRVWTHQWPQLIRSSLTDKDSWAKFSAASIQSQAHSLLSFRARRIFNRSFVRSVYPLETSVFRRAIFSVIASTPILVAQYLVLGAARVFRQDARAIRFDISRSKTLGPSNSVVPSTTRWATATFDTFEGQE